MFGRRRSPEALRTELAEVKARISAHPLASQRIRAAYDIVGNSTSKSVEEVNQELVDNGLPNAEELGRSQVAGSWSWWRLHRRARKLEQKIRRVD